MLEGVSMLEGVMFLIPIVLVIHDEHTNPHNTYCQGINVHLSGKV